MRKNKTGGRPGSLPHAGAGCGSLLSLFSAPYERSVLNRVSVLKFHSVYGATRFHQGSPHATGSRGQIDDPPGPTSDPRFKKNPSDPFFGSAQTEALDVCPPDTFARSPPMGERVWGGGGGGGGSCGGVRGHGGGESPS